MCADVRNRSSAPAARVEATSIDGPDDSASDKSYWPLIATKDEIPKWLRDNDFIIGGHPMPTYSYHRSFRLWRCLHMETMNIWTHLLGCAGCIAAAAAVYGVNKASTTMTLQPGDLFAFGISITAGGLCFGLSTMFHTLRSHSYHVHHFWGKLDIFGICLLAVGGGISATYYAWYCDRTIRNIFWALNTGTAIAAAFTLSDTGGGGSKMRTLRGGVFTLLAVCALLPIFYRGVTLGWSSSCQQFGLQWLLAEGIALVIGVGLFVGRIPERLSPGSFDIWGHSHQLFHICAVLGVGFHVAALYAGFQYRQAVPWC